MGNEGNVCLFLFGINKRRISQKGDAFLGQFTVLGKLEFWVEERNGGFHVMNIWEDLYFMTLDIRP